MITFELRTGIQEDDIPEKAIRLRDTLVFSDFENDLFFKEMNRISATIYAASDDFSTKQRWYFNNRFLNQVLDDEGYLIRYKSGKIFKTTILGETIFYRYFSKPYSEEEKEEIRKFLTRNILNPIMPPKNFLTATF